MAKILTKAERDNMREIVLFQDLGLSLASPAATKLLDSHDEASRRLEAAEARARELEQRYVHIFRGSPATEADPDSRFCDICGEYLTSNLHERANRD